MTIPLPGKRARTRDQLLVAAQQLLLAEARLPGIRQITDAAGLVHASFYNYYPSVDALIADLAALVLASHARIVAGLRAEANNPAELFALVTRQTLRFIATAPQQAQLFFDVGLPVDRLVTGLRAAMTADIDAGIADGSFRVADRDMMLSLVTGAVLGAALDLGRGRLAIAAIDPFTATLLELLGVSPAEAARLASAPARFRAAPPLPLRWLALTGAGDAPDAD